MVHFTIYTLAAIAMALGATAAPSAATSQAPGSSFLFRFYANANCNHDAPASSTFPRNGEGVGHGSTGGNCYSAPTGVDWQRLEIDQTFSGTNHKVITFCNINCQGSGSALQSGTNCYTPFPGCAIGSFKVT
ncbi:hypothetical protein B0T22DRAFT_479099 [Podospora appendiculata]|uniref:Uncharacterized protein n=1 Tax=Podospora appendiculata TaxID=314037 RepID=A0AAE0X834_9PEZI|nr:hypothetical protein B0T22DRAFT_479099 [Podospora appendiculata]